MSSEVRPASILIVDDEADIEPLILQRFRRRIREGELEFTFARNGEEALVKLQANPSIEIILSDINMPVMDGLTLLSKLGGLERLLKTVMVSAYDDMQNIRTAMNRGAFDFLTKPIDFQDFEITLRKTMNELQLIRQSAHHRDQLFALQNELSIASRIQQSILPRRNPPGTQYEIYAEMLPARMVGGDFYDYFPLDDKRVGFAIGDVSGKGIPAALFMAVSRTLLRATVAQNLSPNDCLLYVNHALLRQSEGEMFVTLLYGVLNLQDGSLNYSIAGQTPPHLLRADGSVEALREVRGNMLGLFDDPEIGIGQTVLGLGDLLVLFTDGVPDAENPGGGIFGDHRIKRTLERCSSLDAQRTVECLLNEVKEFSGHAQQSDDITAVALRYLGR